MSARTVLSLGHGNSSLPWHYLAPGNKGCARRQTSWWDGCCPLLGSLTAHGRTTFTLWRSVTVASSKHLRAEVIAWWDLGAPHYRENVHSHFKPWESVQSWEESLNQSRGVHSHTKLFIFKEGYCTWKPELIILTPVYWPLKVFWWLDTHSPLSYDYLPGTSLTAEVGRQVCMCHKGISIGVSSALFSVPSHQEFCSSDHSLKLVNPRDNYSLFWRVWEFLALGYWKQKTA